MDASEPARSDQRPAVSALRLVASLLLAGLFCGLVVEFAYETLLLFALVEAVGIPITAGLAAILLIKSEQGALLLVSRLRPSVLSLILAAIPAAGIALTLRGLLGWNSSPGIWLTVAAGLVIQAVVLYYVNAADARKASGPLACLGPKAATETTPGRQHEPPPAGET